MILSVSSWAIEAADAGLTGFGTFQVYPKDLRTLPRHPDPAVSWHSGFRGGAHARPKKTPVHHAAWRRGGSMAARGARAAAGDAGDAADRISEQPIAGSIHRRARRIPPSARSNRL